MSFLVNVLGFILAVGILVAFHEYGHFWVARRLGVKVLRYSIGFGKPLMRWFGRDGETEYVISAIPLGGYVKMLDEREMEVAPAEVHRAFNRKPVISRLAIVAAGPIANFLFALVAYWAIFVMGTSELRPVVGAVEPESPAAEAGFRVGDELQKVDGAPVEGWKQALMRLLAAGVDHRQIEIEVEQESGQLAVRRLDLRTVSALGEEPDYLAAIGIQPRVPRIEPVVGEVVADPASSAGLQVGDRVLALNDEPVASWSQLVEMIQARPGAAVALSIRRGGNEQVIDVSLARVEQDGRQIGSLGVRPHIPEGLYADMYQDVRYGPLAAVPKAGGATWDTSTLNLKVLWRMVTGEASLKNLSGPINIAQYAGDSVSHGLLPFLEFLAIVSISLGILNLLPIPVLDGGHLLYYTIEGIRGRPLSEQAQLLGQQVGIGFLLLLMSVAIYNDLARIFG